MAFQQADGTVQICKLDIPAWQFVLDKVYIDAIKDFLKPDTRTVLLHARGASCGSPRNNKNNHPLYAGMSAIIHNGSIKNDDSTFTDMQLERKADTDSDIIRAILDKYGITEEAVRKLNKLQGSIAGAGLHPDFPGKVLLLRSGAPMTLATTEDQFFFASEKNTIHRAIRPWVQRFDHWFQVQRPDIAFSPMADHSAWIMDIPTQKKWHGEFKTQVGVYQEPFRRVYQEYESRQQRWNGEVSHQFSSTREIIRIDKNGMKPAWCAKCQKEWAIPAGADYNEWRCPESPRGCGSDLVKPPLVEKVN